VREKVRKKHPFQVTAEQAKNMGNSKLAEVLTDTLRQMQTKIRVKQGKNHSTID